jgi:O-antigen ligase
MDTIRKIFINCLFILPFFQGLYFCHEAIGFTVIFLVLLIGCLVLKKGIKIEKSINSMVLLMLPLLYFIAALYGIDKGMALIGAFKVFTYTVFFLLYTQLYTQSFRERLLNSIIYSAIITALLGVIAYFFTPLERLLIQDNRLGGVFQYANTYGLFCIVALILIIRKKEKKLLEIWGSVLLIIAVILTFSRGILLIGAVVVAIAWFLDKENRVKQGTSLLSGIVIGCTFVKGFGLNEVSTRVSESALHSSEWLTRLIYYKDAYHIIKKFPFGIGYDGYSFVQRTYQTGSNYFVKYVHSNILQYALDIGIIGAILVSIYFISNLVFNKMDGHLKLIFITIVGHGLIDFDFEFPVVFIILIIIIGIQENQIITFSKMWRIPVLCAIALTSICLYLFCATALNYYEQYERASELYPYYTEAKMKYLLQGDGITYEGFLLSHEITEQNKYALEAVVYERDYVYSTKDYEHATFYAKKTMNLNPLNIKHVEVYSDILLEWFQEAMKRNDKETAQFCLEEMNKIPDYLDKLAKERNTDYNIKNKVSLKMTELLIRNYQIANESYSELKDN